MRAFAELLRRLRSNPDGSFQATAIAQYLTDASDQDRICAIYLLRGGKMPRVLSLDLLRQLVIRRTGIPDWLLEASYQATGDWAESLALIVKGCDATDPIPTISLFSCVSRVFGASPPSAESEVLWIEESWRGLEVEPCTVFFKLLVGGLKLKVAPQIIAAGVSMQSGTEASIVVQRLEQVISPLTSSYSTLIESASNQESLHGALPFVAFRGVTESPIVSQSTSLEWRGELLWGGLRAQVVHRPGGLFLWSETGDVVTKQFPELAFLAEFYPVNTVIEGEIRLRAKVGSSEGLRRRTIMLRPSKRALLDLPVEFVAYDIHEDHGEVCRAEPLAQRLTRLYALKEKSPSIEINESSVVRTSRELESLRDRGRDLGASGVLVRLLSQVEGVHTARVTELDTEHFWKCEPRVFVGVMLYGESVRGRSGTSHPRITIGAWSETSLIPVVKIESGLTTEEIALVEDVLQRKSLERFGPVRVVAPELVFEVQYEQIASSLRHKAGLTISGIRSVRVLRSRDPKDASSLESLRASFPAESTP